MLHGLSRVVELVKMSRCVQPFDFLISWKDARSLMLVHGELETFLRVSECSFLVL